MLPHQERYCDWLADLVASESIDCALVAGDVHGLGSLDVLA